MNIEPSKVYDLNRMNGRISIRRDIFSLSSSAKMSLPNIHCNASVMEENKLGAVVEMKSLIPLNHDRSMNLL